MFHIQIDSFQNGQIKRVSDKKVKTELEALIAIRHQLQKGEALQITVNGNHVMGKLMEKAQNELKNN